MKIVVKTHEVKPSGVLSIERAKYLSAFKIKLGFSNGKSTIVNCKHFLMGNAHPSLKKYLKISEFKKFKVLNGNLNWNNYEMIFPIEQLYKGKVD
ncbi:MAG: DUF2442 domain-containing protein [Bacteroidota bacterium]